MGHAAHVPEHSPPLVSEGPALPKQPIVQDQNVVGQPQQPYPLSYFPSFILELLPGIVTQTIAQIAGYLPGSQRVGIFPPNPSEWIPFHLGYYPGRTGYYPGQHFPGHPGYVPSPGYYPDHPRYEPHHYYPPGYGFHYPQI